MTADDLSCFRSALPIEDIHISAIIFDKNERVKKLGDHWGFFRTLFGFLRSCTVKNRSTVSSGKIISLKRQRAEMRRRLKILVH
jgi:hypothetical protein